MGYFNEIFRKTRFESCINETPSSQSNPVTESTSAMTHFPAHLSLNESDCPLNHVELMMQFLKAVIY